MTSENSPPRDCAMTELFPMSSVEASPAKTLAAQEWARELRARSRASGSNTPVLLASFDPSTSSWRTSQCSLLGGFTEFSETWPRSGLMRSGIAYQLPPLVRRTNVTVFGLWPTPRANDPQKRGRIANTARNGLAAAVRYWPTPRAAKRGPRNPATAAVKLASSGRKSFHRLEDATAYDESMIGIPNPRFVEWLMGFPQMWTE